MERSKDNSEHYKWGNNCSGWHLVKSQNLSIIQELMPPNTSEQKHYHNFSEQFFYILKGEATFEIGKEIIIIKEGNSIHINSQKKHKIINETNLNLEFLVISQPTTEGDRIDFPFEQKQLINLNGKSFKPISNSNNGEVSSKTIFNYRQNNNIIWATYEGGDVLFGTLSGKISGNILNFNYQHQNLKGEFMTGNCESTIHLENKIIKLFEKWKWTSGDLSKGESILEEITAL